MRLNGILSEGTAKGHSIRSIIAENGGEEAFGYSARTIYRYIDGCVFPDVRNIDLVRKVRYKPRKRNPSSAIKVDKSCRIGRKYSDYLSYIEDNPETATVQIDTVEGKKGGCCLLTIHFTATHLMLAIVIHCPVLSIVEILYSGKDDLRMIGRDDLLLHEHSDLGFIRDTKRIDSIFPRLHESRKQFHINERNRRIACSIFLEDTFPNLLVISHLCFSFILLRQ